jgi:hypothetical protein
MKSSSLLTCTAVALLFAAGVHAETDSHPDADTSEAHVKPQQFDEYRRELEYELDHGSIGDALSDREHIEVRDILSRMSGMLARVDNVEKLNRRSKLKLYNDQERLRVLLAQGDDETRQVCRRDRITGSHRPSTICRTVAEWRSYREANQDFMRRHQASQMPKGD